MEGNMDDDIGPRILEFLLRQPLEKPLLNSLIKVLPLPNDNPDIKRILLLRKIEFEISKGHVSESILDCLEKYEELDFQNGVEQHSESMKVAYCAVAVACTVRFLKSKGGHSNYEYFEAVKRIWRGKVCKMEKAENVALISQELLIWKRELENALWNDSACDNVLQRTKEMDPVGAVRAFVHEEQEKMGPSFLEFLAQKVRINDTLRKLLYDASNANLGQAGEKKENLATPADHESGPSDGNTGHKETVLSRRQNIALNCTRGPRSGTSGGSKNADTGNFEVDPSGKHCDLLPTPNLNEVQEDLREKENARKETVAQTKASDDPSFVESSKAVQANKEDLSTHCKDVRNNAPKRSLMESNTTARTNEWDESLDDKPDIPPSGKRSRLPSPEGLLVSPLKESEANKFMKRRRPKRWSTLEEETLRSAVDKYGSGSWKLILMANREVFGERTQVDLKDKWRNMTR
ncbi:hypothetical protein M9H77_10366 [Catharanthus roseus]|uniref:Uncharacterized protein n=1 Tax=Catharanthus roseus TaxID=4058 RepID=A0ACC0C3E7_CATRO|nr:hypothetical protein M9H77_10366 [Catharanthus roseus]